MVEFRDVVKKYAGTDEALGVPAGTVGGIPVGAAASMSPVEVVTDPDAQAALSGAFGPLTCLYLPGVSGNFVSTPDASDLRITGDIDLRALLLPDNWYAATAGTIIDKGDAATQQSYLFRVASGGLSLSLTSDGTSATNTTAISDGPVPGEGFRWVRCTWRQSDGRVQFFWAPPGDDWTQIGVDRTIAVASIHPGTAPLQVGGRGASGSTHPFIGRIARVQVRSGIDGTVVADYRADAPMGPRYRDATGKVWTINGSAWTWGVAL